MREGECMIELSLPDGTSRLFGPHPIEEAEGMCGSFNRIMAGRTPDEGIRMRTVDHHWRGGKDMGITGEDMAEALAPLTARTKMGENDRAVFYRNRTCEAMDRKMHTMDADGLSLDGWHAYLVEMKEGGTRAYLVLDADNEPRFDCADLYEFDFKERIARMGLGDDLRLTEIAKTGRIPKVGV